MAVICRNKKLLFILNPRSGSSALGDHLIKKFEGEWIPKERYYDTNLNRYIDFKHNTVEDLLEAKLITTNELEELIVFTTVAHPYDNLRTLYAKYRYRYEQWKNEGRHFLQSENVQKNIDFCKKHNINQWILKELWKASIKAILRLEEYSINYSFPKYCHAVLKKEQLQSDFEQFLVKYNVIGDKNIPKINKTENKDGGVDNFNLLSKLLIYIVYYRDFKKYSYRF